MPTLLGRCFAFAVLCALCSLGAAQDVGVAQVGNASTLDPAVALEFRIQSLIDEIGISGEQEPSFRVAMQQVSDLESAYLNSEHDKDAQFANASALLAASEKLLALILYPTQVAAFRELEQEHLWQMRGHSN